MIIWLLEVGEYGGLIVGAFSSKAAAVSHAAAYTPEAWRVLEVELDAAENRRLPNVATVSPRRLIP